MWVSAAAFSSRGTGLCLSWDVKGKWQKSVFCGCCCVERFLLLRVCGTGTSSLQQSSRRCFGGQSRCGASASHGLSEA